MVNDAFIKSLQQYQKDFTEALEDAAKNLVLVVAESLINLSPVGRPEQWSELVYYHRVKGGGYEPGQYKASWTIGVNSIPTLTFKSGPHELSEDSLLGGIIFQVSNLKLGDSVAIVNTATNDSYEYYPAILELHTTSTYTAPPSTSSSEEGYRDSLNQHLPAMTYDWYAKHQDGVIAPTAIRVPQFLQDAFKSTGPLKLKDST